MLVKVSQPTLAVAVCIIVATVTTNANADRKTFPIRLNDDTKDIHIQVNGTMKNGKPKTVTPKVQDEDGHNSLKKWSGAWHQPPGGEVTLEIERTSGKAWKFEYMLTTDGKTDWPQPFVPSTPASCYTEVHGDPFVELFVENLLGTSSVAVTDISLTVISDPEMYDSDNWYDATGDVYTFNDVVIPPGAELSLNPSTWISVDENQWVLVSAKYNGVQEFYANGVKVPEPANLALCLMGCLILLRHKR